MPSPIAHAAAGYVVHKLYKGSKKASKQNLSWQLLFVMMGLSLLPDLDAIPGILLGDFKQFHNNISHSFFWGFIVSILIGSFMWVKQKRFKEWFFITLACYELHVIMDYFTIGGRGVLVLWPFSTNRYEAPIKLFYGVRWSDGLVSLNHLWTIFTEIGLVVVLYLILNYLLSSKFVPNESPV